MCVCKEKKFYYKELSHAIVEADESKICGPVGCRPVELVVQFQSKGWQPEDPEGVMVQTKSEVNLLET